MNNDTDDDWLLYLLMVVIGFGVIAMLGGMCYSAKKIGKAPGVYGGINVYMDNRLK